MEPVIHKQSHRLVILGFTLFLSVIVALLFYKGPVIFGTINSSIAQDSEGDSYLAAVHGSYSRHQPHTHEKFVAGSARTVSDTPTSTPPTPAPVVVAPKPAPTPAPTPVVVATPAPAPKPTTTQTPAPTTATTAKPATSTPSPTTQTSVSTPAIVATPQVTAAAVAPVAATGFGLAVGASLSGLSDAALNQELTTIASLGATWVRYDFEWDQIQAGGKTSFDWTVTDRIVKAVNAHHLKLLPILAYSPAWAEPTGCVDYMCGPKNPADYAAFAKAAAARYAPQGVHAWEIWNEPNISEFWETGPNAAAYVALLKAAYPAIKSVDPSATVITAGLSPSGNYGGDIAPTDYLTQMYADGAKNYFDAVGFHPYTYPALPSSAVSWDAWGEMSTTPGANVRSIMIANGDGAKKVWMTEYGAPTGGPGTQATLANLNFTGSPDHVDEALQQQMLIDAVTLWRSYSWAGPLFWYSYQDTGIAANTNENFFGLLRFDGSPKPAFTTLKQLLAQ